LVDKRKETDVLTGGLEACHGHFEIRECARCWGVEDLTEAVCVEAVIERQWDGISETATRSVLVAPSVRRDSVVADLGGVRSGICPSGEVPVSAIRRTSVRANIELEDEVATGGGCRKRHGAVIKSRTVVLEEGC